MTFYSFAGTTYKGGSSGFRESDEHPGADEYRASRKDTSHDATGFEPGEKFLFRGDPAQVIAEEKRPGGDGVDLIFRRSSRNDSGTYRMTWKPGSHEREMCSGETRRIYE